MTVIGTISILSGSYWRSQLLVDHIWTQTRLCHHQWLLMLQHLLLLRFQVISLDEARRGRHHGSVWQLGKVKGGIWYGPGPSWLRCALRRWLEVYVVLLDSGLSVRRRGKRDSLEELTLKDWLAHFHTLSDVSLSRLEDLARLGYRPPMVRSFVHLWAWCLVGFDDSLWTLLLI